MQFFKNKRKIIVLIIIAILLYGVLYILFTKTRVNQFVTSDNEQSVPQNNETGYEVIAEDLYIPWDLVFLPDGDILVSERSGSIMLITGGKKERVHHLTVSTARDDGLHGMALHPDFSKNRFVYFYYTHFNFKEKQTLNKLERYVYDNKQLTDRTVIIDNIRGNWSHNGGRIAFGPDGYLYVTTGEAWDAKEAQNKESLGGKILRLHDDGSIPEDNPFPNSPIYSYGHRNPQGITWDSNGNLWSTEHGDTGLDEVNLIVPGGNYGYPDSRGDFVQNNTIGPKIHAGQDTWAPSGIAFHGGSLFFGGLRGQSLYEVVLSDTSVKELKRHFHQKFGRIRTVIIGPDGFLYFTTSNGDNRGSKKAGDDKIIKIKTLVNGTGSGF